MKARWSTMLFFCLCLFDANVMVVVAQPKQELTPEQSERLNQHKALAKKVSGLIAESRFADAVDAAKSFVTISKEIYGEKHWRTFDANQTLKFVETALTFSEEKQKKLLETARAETEAQKLAVVKPKDAIRLVHTAIVGYRNLFGDETPEVARNWYLVGQIESRNNNPKAAKEAYEKALRINRAILPELHPDLARALGALGLVQSALRDPVSAKASHLEALAIRRKVLPKDHLDIALSLNNLGNTQYALGDYEGAKKSHTETLAIYRKVLPKEHPDIAFGLNGLGSVQRALGDYEGARASHSEALAIRRKSLPKDDPLIASSLSNLGNAQDALRDYEAAKQSHSEALSIRRKVLPKDHPDLALSLNGLGSAQHALKEYQAAKECYTESLAIRRKTLPQDHLDIARSLYNLGVTQNDLRDYEAAKQSYAEALVIRRKRLPKDDSKIADTLINLGLVQRALREFPAAKDSHTEAVAIRRKTLPKDHPNLADSLSNLGIVQNDLREYEAAKKSHTEALAIFQKTLPNDHPRIATVLLNRSVTLEALSDHEGAKQSLLAALAISRKTSPQDRVQIAMILNNLGVVQASLLNHEEAQASFTEALSIYRKILPNNHPEIAKNLTNLGSVQTALFDFKAAKQSQSEALAILREIFSKVDPQVAIGLNNLGVAQNNLREYVAAKKSHTEALAIRRHALPSDHPHIAQSLTNLALIELVTNGTPSPVVGLLTEALAITRADMTRLASSQAEAEQLTAAYHSLGRLSLYLSAIVEVGRDATLDYHQVASFKGAVTARQRWTREVRNNQDATTVDLLRKLSHVDQELLSSSFPQALRERLHPLTDPKKLLEGLQEQRKDLELQLSAHSEAYRLFKVKANIGGDELRTSLPAGTCLLDFREYLHFAPPMNGKNEPLIEQRLIAFVVKPGTAKVALVSLGQAELIAKLIDRWRDTYGVGRLPKADEPDPAAALSKILWQPLQKHLNNDIKTILISPDGPLNGLPFAALPGQKAGSYLLEEYAFVNVPTPILLPEILEKKPSVLKSRNALIFGDIDFDAAATSSKSAHQFTRLPGTDAEAKAVATLCRSTFPDSKVDLITGKEATKQAFLARTAQADHLLLATHGFFLPEPKAEAEERMQLVSRAFNFDRRVVVSNPALRSGLVFAGANNTDIVGKGDAFLTALEASELDLKATELAILSACETGLGQAQSGEGVLGLQRAFQVAGAKTTVTSLWKVPDRATQALMVRFHENLWGCERGGKKIEPMGRVQALREAQLWIIAEAKVQPDLLRGTLEPLNRQFKKGDPVPPYFWAAFVLSGDWR